jgi:predicted aspartyl protease
MLRHPRFLTSLITCLIVVAQAHAKHVHPTESAFALGEPAESVRFDLYLGYCIVVHGAAGPLKNLNFLVDTGSSRSILNAPLANKLSLSDVERTDIVFVNGKQRAYDAILPALEIGTMRQAKLRVNVTDLSVFKKYLPVPIDGIIGLDVLGQAPFVIDYSARVIRFGSAAALPVSASLRIDGGLAVVDAEIDHLPVHLMFDTGVASIILFKTEKQSGTGTGSAVDQQTRDKGELEGQSFQLQSLRVGLKEFGRKAAVLTANPKSSQLDFDGLINPATLGVSQVSVDIRRGVIGFSL